MSTYYVHRANAFKFKSCQIAWSDLCRSLFSLSNSKVCLFIYGALFSARARAHAKCVDQQSIIDMYLMLSLLQCSLYLSLPSNYIFLFKFSLDCLLYYDFVQGQTCDQTFKILLADAITAIIMINFYCMVLDAWSLMIFKIIACQKAIYTCVFHLKWLLWWNWPK